VRRQRALRGRRGARDDLYEPPLPRRNRAARSFSKSIAIAGSGLIRPIRRPSSATSDLATDVIAPLDRDAERHRIEVAGAELPVRGPGSASASLNRREQLKRFPISEHSRGNAESGCGLCDAHRD
jgi:hypothetical protein